MLRRIYTFPALTEVMLATKRAQVNTQTRTTEQLVITFTESEHEGFHSQAPI